MTRPVGDFIPTPEMVRGNTTNANATKLALRRLKVAMRADTVDWVECLRGNPPATHALGVERVKVGTFLRDVRGVSEGLQWEICKAADIAPHMRLGDLGVMTRNHLARLTLAALSPFDPRLGPIEAELLEGQPPETAASTDEEGPALGIDTSGIRRQRRDAGIHRDGTPI